MAIKAGYDPQELTTAATTALMLRLSTLLKTHDRSGS
jgi:hypothetical protein